MLPLVAWSLTVVPTYLVWHWAAGGGPWRVPPIVLALEYGVPLLVAACAIWRAWPLSTGRQRARRIRGY